MATTVSSINKTIKGIRDAAGDMAKLLTAVQTDPKFSEAVVKATDQKIIDYSINMAIRYLNEYAGLMENTRDNTEVNWPPA